MPVRQPGAGTLAQGLARSPTPPAAGGTCGSWETWGQEGREGPPSPLRPCGSQCYMYGGNCHTFGAAKCNSITGIVTVQSRNRLWGRPGICFPRHEGFLGDVKPTRPRGMVLLLEPSSRLCPRAAGWWGEGPTWDSHGVGKGGEAAVLGGPQVPTQVQEAEGGGSGWFAGLARVFETSTCSPAAA